MTYTLAASFLISFAVTALAGLVLIPLLKRLKAGQSIKRNGPVWHMSKEGTPTMGGLMFILGIGAAVVITGWEGMKQVTVSLAMFAFALLHQP
jgi:phospho-N-acetylmuramoyl-pentapeptide-transferase